MGVVSHWLGKDVERWVGRLIAFHAEVVLARSTHGRPNGKNIPVFRCRADLLGCSGLACQKERLEFFGNKACGGGFVEVDVEALFALLVVEFLLESALRLYISAARLCCPVVCCAQWFWDISEGLVLDLELWSAV